MSDSPVSNRFLSKSRSRSSSPPKKRSSTKSRSKSRKPRQSSSKSLSKSPRRPSKTNNNNSKRGKAEPNCCIGVFGLSPRTTERELESIFSRYGSIERLHLVTDRYTKESRGYCFIHYDTVSAASKAVSKADGMEIDGREVRADFSLTQRPHTPTPGHYMGKRTDRGAPRDRGGYGGGRDRSGSPPPYRGRRQRSRSPGSPYRGRRSRSPGSPPPSSYRRRRSRSPRSPAYSRRDRSRSRDRSRRRNGGY